MEVFTPLFNTTYAVFDQIKIVANTPEKVVAQMLIMCEYGHEPEREKEIDYRWHDHDFYDTDLNIAEKLLSYRDENGYIFFDPGTSVDLGYFVTLLAPNPHNPFDLVAVVRLGRLSKGEGLDLLKLCAKHNIFTIPVGPIHFPANFIREKYKNDPGKGLVSNWSPQIWEHYIKDIMVHYFVASPRFFRISSNPVEIPDI